MFEILEGLLEIIVEVLLDAALEFAAESIVASIGRGLAKISSESAFENPIVAAVGYVLLGGLAGALSLIFFSHPLVHRSRIPGLSMILSPLLTGLGMSLVGSTLRKRNKRAMRIESFGYGFAFALGMSAVRFFLAK